MLPTPDPSKRGRRGVGSRRKRVSIRTEVPEESSFKSEFSLDSQLLYHSSISSHKPSVESTFTLTSISARQLSLRIRKYQGPEIQNALKKVRRSSEIIRLKDTSENIEMKPPSNSISTSPTPVSSKELSPRIRKQNFPDVQNAPKKVRRSSEIIRLGNLIEDVGTNFTRNSISTTPTPEKPILPPSFLLESSVPSTPPPLPLSASSQRYSIPGTPTSPQDSPSSSAPHFCLSLVSEQSVSEPNDLVSNSQNQISMITEPGLLDQSHQMSATNSDTESCVEELVVQKECKIAAQPAGNPTTSTDFYTSLPARTKYPANSVAHTAIHSSPIPAPLSSFSIEKQLDDLHRRVIPHEELFFKTPKPYSNPTAKFVTPAHSVDTAASKMWNPTPANISTEQSTFFSPPNSTNSSPHNIPNTTEKMKNLVTANKTKLVQKLHGEQRIGGLLPGKQKMLDAKKEENSKQQRKAAERRAEIERNHDEQVIQKVKEWGRQLMREKMFEQSQRGEVKGREEGNREMGTSPIEPSNSEIATTSGFMSSGKYPNSNPTSYPLDGLRSDISEDGENPHHAVPSWATDPCLLQRVHVQCTECANPEGIFPPYHLLQPMELPLIFGFSIFRRCNRSDNYRTSSAHLTSPMWKLS